MNLPNYPKCPSNGEPWIMSVPVVSTAHITQCDAELLAEDALDYEEGVILNIAETIGLDIQLSTECFALLRAFQDLGYMWVRFDRDGDVLEGVPKFEW